MRFCVKLFGCAGMLLAAGLAQAQIFVCKDAAGRTYSGDRPLPECANQPMRELRGDGMLRRDYPAPLTLQQRQQKQQEEEQRRAAGIALEAQRQSDRRLLLIYPQESHLEAARSRATALQQERIGQAAAAIASAQQRLQQAQAELGRHPGKTVPPDLRDTIETTQHTILDQQQAMRLAETELRQLNLRFDADLKRYREIVAAGQRAQ